MTARLFAGVLAVALPLLAAAADPPKPGKLVWGHQTKAKDKDEVKWPRAVPATADRKAGVELFGEAVCEPDWRVKEVQYSYAPAAGGDLTGPTKLDLHDGKWGELDPADKAKKTVRPARAELPPGDWNLFVSATFERATPSGRVVESTAWLLPVARVTVK
jgi:hypothetical protein